MRFDILGFAFFSIAIASLQLFLDRGQQLDWFAATEIWIELGTFLLAMYMFLVQILTAEHPFVAREMFLDRNFFSRATADFCGRWNSARHARIAHSLP
jgi:DHA2 family multidrug resistance protein